MYEDKIINLNVSGKKTSVSSSVLYQLDYFKNYFERWDGNGELFVNCDYKLFNQLINCVRIPNYTVPLKYIDNINNIKQFYGFKEIGPNSKKKMLVVKKLVKDIDFDFIMRNEYSDYYISDLEFYASEHYSKAYHETYITDYHHRYHKFLYVDFIGSKFFFNDVFGDPVTSRYRYRDETQKCFFTCPINKKFIELFQGGFKIIIKDKHCDSETDRYMYRYFGTHLGDCKIIFYLKLKQ